MTRLVLIGSGGHAREVLEIALDCREHGLDIEPVGFIDEDPQRHGLILGGFPVLGGFDWFESPAHRDVEVVAATGSPALCRKFALAAHALGLRFVSVVSPHAHVSPMACIGQGVMVFPGVVVNIGARIGNHVTLNVGATVSHDTTVGAYCNINPGVRLAGEVCIGEGCYVGMGANVIQQVSIGAGSIIGAGAVVIRDVPPAVTAVGVPARVVKRSMPDRA
jgi:sugar O-acyltransferase (sialic acid O-acetyltransferase NeuD family)